ncbi:MAG: DUF192 domain-containing protein [Candidatus Shapirobacteria bacterium]|nr:DUF192 domain-containing protein [Candidatus Shapirobacteria bacterium]
MSKYILPTIIFLILAVVASFLFSQRSPSKTISIKIKDKNFNLEVAKTLTQKAKGLGDRTELCSNCGMIFLFSQDDIQSFWMKDTLITLDIIWVNSQGKVVYIATASPEPNTPNNQLKIYKNTEPAKYVIELNPGISEKIGLHIGDHIELPNLND